MVKKEKTKEKDEKKEIKKSEFEGDIEDAEIEIDLETLNKFLGTSAVVEINSNVQQLGNTNNQILERDVKEFIPKEDNKESEKVTYESSVVNYVESNNSQANYDNNRTNENSQMINLKTLRNNESSDNRPVQQFDNNFWQREMGGNSRRGNVMQEKDSYINAPVERANYDNNLPFQQKEKKRKM